MGVIKLFTLTVKSLMKLLSGSRWSLPDDGRPAAKLDDGESVLVTLSGFFKGNMCVGSRKVSCVFFKPVGPEPWVYSSKSRFLDIVKWVESHGFDFKTEFNLKYVGILQPMTDSDLVKNIEISRLAISINYGPIQGSTS